MTKYSAALVDQIINLIKVGNYAIDACMASGVGETTYYEWLKTKPEFRESIKKARAEATAVKVARIHKAGQDGNWQADAWWLERVHRKKFGKQESNDLPPPNITMGFQPKSKFIEPIDAKVIQPNAAQLHSRQIGEVLGKKAKVDGRPRKKGIVPRKRS